MADRADVLRAELDEHRAAIRRIEVRLAYHLQLRAKREPTPQPFMSRSREERLAAAFGLPRHAIGVERYKALMAGVREPGETA